MHRREIPVASPCDAVWEEMRGDHVRRFCGRCEKHVHNLSALSEVDARRLLDAAPPGRLCVQYVSDGAGRIQFRSAKRALPRVRGAVAAAASGLLAACAAPAEDAADAEVPADGGVLPASDEIGFAGAGSEAASTTKASAIDGIVAIPVPVLDTNVLGRPAVATDPVGGAHDSDAPRHANSAGLDDEPRFIMGKMAAPPREHVPPRIHASGRMGTFVRGDISVGQMEFIGTGGEIVLGSD